MKKRVKILINGDYNGFLEFARFKVDTMEGGIERYHFFDDKGVYVAILRVENGLSLEFK